MKGIPARLRRFVIQQAYNRCEYCRLSQIGQEAAFHIDHIKPVAAGGQTIESNLALSCVSCSLRKGAKQMAIDPATGEKSTLYNPRESFWRSHFQWDEVAIIGITAVGRATVAALDLNRPLILMIRREEIRLGRSL